MNPSALGGLLCLTGEDIVVIYDDMDLPVGKIACACKEAQGHNGMKSIIEQLGTKEFNRIR